MSIEPYRIFPLGIDALTIELGNEISPVLNDIVINLSQYFENDQFEGFVETVPAYSSLTIFYDVFTVRKAYSDYPTAFEAVKGFAEIAFRSAGRSVNSAPRLIEIPVNFGDEFAPDLDFLAAAADLTADQVIEIFTAQTYRVYMLGFLPGFPYLGEVDERIAAPRKPFPRLIVPRGSVGIAGRQTGIYPFDSPGGWQIIGRTDFELFAPNADQPCALRAGDSVRFYASNK